MHCLQTRYPTWSGPCPSRQFLSLFSRLRGRGAGPLRPYLQRRDPRVSGDHLLEGHGRGGSAATPVAMGGGFWLNPWTGTLCWQGTFLEHVGAGASTDLRLAWNLESDRQGMFGPGFWSNPERRVEPVPWSRWLMVEEDGLANRFTRGQAPDEEVVGEMLDETVHNRRRQEPGSLRRKNDRKHRTALPSSSYFRRLDSGLHLTIATVW